MNQLQDFLADCNEQSQDANQEIAVLNGKEIYGTFGDAQTMPIMTPNGYQDHIVTQFKARRTWFSQNPVAKQEITRPATGRTFFIQMVDYTNPVVYTFILTDREV